MINKPYRRIIRPFPSAAFKIEQPPFERDYFCSPISSNNEYLEDPEYAPEYANLIQAYYLIEKDLIQLFEYVDPADENLSTYSHRLYELFLRASTEFETNCKGILRANKYPTSERDWNIKDYCKINSSSRLSDYDIQIIRWQSPQKILQPFGDWSTEDKSLSWYGDYNKVKHDRNKHFKLANLNNVLLAVSSVLAVLFSQFHINCFCTHYSVGPYNYGGGGWYFHKDSMFGIKPAQKWLDDECYDFDWSALRTKEDRFGTYVF